MHTNRRQFLGSLALGLAAPGLIRAQSARRVIVVGAGAAGITAANVLREAGTDVTVLEAASRWGGRIRRLDGFADFPIDLGAEWIHSSPRVLDQVAGRRVRDQVETIEYRPRTYDVWTDGQLGKANYLRRLYSETKFFRTTWYGFFERFMVPPVADRIVTRAPVSDIDYSGPDIAVRAGGRTYFADAVIVTVPLAILKAGAIRFRPDPPPSHLRALGGFDVGSGFKVFLNFRERFYSDMLITQSTRSFLADTWTEKLYYDAAFGKQAQTNVLGLFRSSLGPIARAGLGDEALLAEVLAELDLIYEGAATRHLIGAHVRNWSRDPLFRGTYSTEYDYAEFDSIEEIFAPLARRVFFAGEALGGDVQSTVQGASLSGRAAAQRLL